MHHKPYAIVVVLAILLASFYFLRNSARVVQEFGNLDTFYDNFEHFNSRAAIDSTGCHPYIPSPIEVDTRKFSGPEMVSCATWMQQWAEQNDEWLVEISPKLFEKRSQNGNNNYTCTYTEIDVDSNNVSPIEEIMDPSVPTRVPLETFAVLCRDPLANFFYIRTFVDFSKRIAQIDGPRPFTGPRKESLLIISISGLSHNQAMRHLPNTLKFAEHNDFVAFSMFNQASFNNSINRHINFYGNGSEKSVWEIAKDNGCLTSVNVDPLSQNTHQQFTDADISTHLYNSYNNAHLIFRNETPYCLYNGRAISDDLLEISRRLHRSIRNRCHVSFVELSEITARVDGAIRSIDESLRNLINGVDYRTTSVVIVSDGGNRDSATWQTENGRHEAKFGLFLVRMSDEFREKFPEKMGKLRANIDRLITNSNVFATLSGIISNSQNSQMSLLDNVVERNRSCHVANISNDTCVCTIASKMRRDEMIVMRKKLEEAVRAELSILKCVTRIFVPPEFERIDEIRSIERSILIESIVFVNARPTYDKFLPEN